MKTPILDKAMREMKRDHCIPKPARAQRLLPQGIPRYVRCYDNGGESIDRYTVVFTGNYSNRNGTDYLAMNAAPFHPQGFGQHGWVDRFADFETNKHGFAPAIGRKNHLGTRIRFEDLPEDCRELVMQDYRQMWKLATTP